MTPGRAGQSPRPDLVASFTVVGDPREAHHLVRHLLFSLAGGMGGDDGVGVGASVAINIADTDTVAVVSGGADVTADGITAAATMGGDGTHTSGATAISGASGEGVGIAGSFALNVSNTLTEAALKDGSTSNVGIGNVVLTAASTSSAWTAASNFSWL